MSVKVTSFDDPAVWKYVHDDAPGGSHGGTLDPATVTYGVNIDGSDNLNVVVVPCPFEGCGSVSYWPPGGGADALLGQSLHVMVAMQPGLAREAKSAEQAAAEVKQRVIDTDGEARWVLDDAALALLEASQDEMTGSYIDDRLWAVIIGEGQFNPDSAIYRYWRSLKQADPPQYLGVPVTPEIQTEVGVQQGFASGAVINWSPDTGAELADG